MSIFSKLKALFVKPQEIKIKSSTPVEYGILATNTTPFSADFSQGYNPGRAENQKFVVADTTNNIYSGYPTASGWGKYVQLAHIVPSLDAVDFSKGYNPAMAENGKFVQLELDDAIDFPEKKFGHHKYAVLTYIVNPDALQIQGGTLSGDLDLDNYDILNVNNLFSNYIETTCGNSEEWCSVYTQVNELSDDWGGSVIETEYLSAFFIETSCGNSDQWCSAYTQVYLLSDDWDSVYNHVNHLSDVWSGNFCNEIVHISQISACLPNNTIQITGSLSVTENISSNCGNSDEWCSVYTNVNQLSDGWESVYTQTNLLSDTWNGNFCDEIVHISQISACLPNSTIEVSGSLSVSENISSNCGNSEEWCSVYTNVNQLSDDWSSVYTQTNLLSDDWSSVYTQTNLLSDDWDNGNIPLYLQAYIPFDSSTQSVPYYLFGKSSASNTFKDVVEINELQMSFGIPNANLGSNIVAFYARLFKWDIGTSTNILLASANQDTVSPLVQANMYKISVPVNTNNLIEANDGVWFVIDGDGTANSDNTNTLSINNNSYNNLDNITISIGYNTV